ncbi:uncharacterized protein [Penaeus vannamei]|uniref:uncharacterized protein n=1 Tax=Penaeus vannamei TaxID=6689 RepID=UPI00387F8780
MHLVTSLLVARCLALVTLSPPHVSADCVAVFSGQEKPCTSVCVVPSSPSQLPTCSTHKNGNSQYGPCSSDCDSSYCSEECQLRIAQVSGGASQTTTAAGNDASTAVAGFSTTLSTMPVTLITSSTMSGAETRAAEAEQESANTSHEDNGKYYAVQ